MRAIKCLLLLCVIMVLPIALSAADTGIHYDFKPRMDRWSAPREVICLDGEWEYRLMAPRPDKCEPVWEKHLTPYVAKGDLSVRWPQQYRRTFILGPDHGFRTILHFECIPGRCRIEVNGRLVLIHDPGELPFDCDVTDYVREGENSIFFEVSGLSKAEESARVFIEEMRYQRMSRQGYLRPIVLERRPKVSVEDVTIVTKVEPRKVLQASIVVTNASTEVRAIELIASVGDWCSELQQLSVPGGTAVRVNLSRIWPDVPLWNPETPNLHFLRINLSECGKLIDSHIERFGFREVRIDGDRLLLNGYPLLVRRDTDLGYGWNSDEDVRRILLQLRNRGFWGNRLAPMFLSSVIDAADELGVLLTVNQSGDTKARQRGTNDVSWAYHDRYLAEVQQYYKNRPSVICWGTANEFSFIYGLGNGTDEEKRNLVEREQQLGLNLAKRDPTRPWTSFGDVEVGWPVTGEGPAPIRSFHYPRSPCSDDWCCLPEMAWWYKRGERSFQGRSIHTKPLSISEDLYHGFLDQFFGMAKWAGDSIYTTDGYFKAWADAVLMLADGYYDSGICCWNIWWTGAARFPQSRLFDAHGKIAPDYLVSLRETFPNLRSGGREKRHLTAYNVLFLPRDCRLVRTVRGDDGEVSRDEWMFRLSPGGRWDAEIDVSAPKVKRVTRLVHRYELVEVGTNRKLYEREYVFNVFPERKLRGAGDVTVLADGNSALKDSGLSVGEAIAAGKPIVVHRSLSNGDGEALRRYVIGGGRVMLIDLPQASWKPLRIDYGKPLSFVFRRTAGAMKGISDEMLRVWRPATLLGDSGYVKTGSRTMKVIFDAAHRDGLTAAQVARLYDGRGWWFLCQLPLARKVSVDPAADMVLAAAFAEFEKDDGLDGRLTMDGDDELAKVFLNEGILVSTESPRSYADVLGVDGSVKFSNRQIAEFETFAKKGGTTLILGVGTENVEWLLRHLLKLAPLTNGCEQVERMDNGGILAGISNQDLFFSNEKLSLKRFRNELGGKPDTLKRSNDFLTGALEATGDFSGLIRTTPGAIAEIPCGRGKIVVTTIKWGTIYKKYPDKTFFLLRTLLANLGVNATAESKIADFVPVEFSGEKLRKYWDDPKIPGVKAWFGEYDDMRYFPVNLCGFSPDSGNLCPVEELPKGLLTYAGTRFQLTAKVQERTGYRYPMALVLEPGEEVRFGCSASQVASIRFLGATKNQLKRGWGYGQSALKVRCNGSVQSEMLTIGGDHVNAYGWAGDIKSGRIAWNGPSRKETSAVLYSWSLPIPGGTMSRIESVDLLNDGVSPIAILAISLVTEK